MTAQFCRLPIVVEPRRWFKDATGNVVQEYPLQVGSILIHWADPVRAAGWFQEAWRLLNDADRLEKLNAPVNTSDRNTNTRQATEQFGYVMDVLRALSHGYNQLNILWHNDPIAREAYRRFIAGSPKVSGSNASSVFDAGLDYNPDWYTKDEYLPGAQNTTLLQSVALDETDGKPGDRFAPVAMLVVASMDPLPNNGPVALSRRVFNAPYLATATRQSCPVGPVYKDLSTVDFTGFIDFPWSKRCESNAQGFGRMLKAIMPDGSNLPEGFDDWRASYWGQMFFQNVFDEGKHFITAPLVEHLSWLRAWAQSLVSRSPAQIIQDSRAYTAWQNLRTLSANASALEQIGNLGGTISQQQHAPDAGLELAAGTLGIVGGVAAAAGGPVGAVVGLVAGATAAVIKVTDAVVTKGTKGIGRDDLGRYKPQLERAWLSGDPATALVSAGAPALPDSELQDPPGMGTTWDPQECPTVPIRAGSSGSPSGTVTGWWQSLSTPAKWGVGLGAGAAGLGVAAMASRAFQQTPPQPGRSRAR
jgi:hypothetical protein